MFRGVRGQRKIIGENNRKGNVVSERFWPLVRVVGGFEIESGKGVRHEAGELSRARTL